MTELLVPITRLEDAPFPSEQAVFIACTDGKLMEAWVDRDHVTATEEGNPALRVSWFSLNSDGTANIRVPGEIMTHPLPSSLTVRLPKN